MQIRRKIDAYMWLNVMCEKFQAFNDQVNELPDGKEWADALHATFDDISDQMHDALDLLADQPDD